MKATPTTGDIITTKTGEQYRVLSVDGDTVQGIEYSNGDTLVFPRIKTILIENIKP
jgi:hypothetical protein